ncbi:putative quinol monooxygenase [Flavobacterium tyrosinilyticum]|uniref:putative quinol monooxygenase n=1 Tax=Flavobacterium tyrosinilyticum TaxID=1658740 RepID=UPI00202F4930|nr:antibiotic biosynthesis monooxygenase family protein [Flavobacterium tyrosinilyticum]MCM0667012.1 antibiotic biosynthesis monooxygenase [Flavobacterium tyrosinilyticum]
MNGFWNKIKVSFLFTFFSLGIMAQNKDQMVRIAEVEIIPDYLEQYKAILKEEAEASIRLEPGVIVIFPMFQKDHPNQIKILEIYANNEAYQSHLKTPHFLLYKTSTLKMVKSLKLNDLVALDVEAMSALFKKYQ